MKKIGNFENIPQFLKNSAILKKIRKFENIPQFKKKFPNFEKNPNFSKLSKFSKKLPFIITKKLLKLSKNAEIIKNCRNYQKIPKL